MLEVVLGIIIGPQVLGLVQFDGIVASMFAFGMAATLFMAGMELEFERIRGRPLWLAVGGWGMSVALGLSAAAVLHASRLHDPMIVALALATTSLGTLLPILRDADQLDTPFGRLFIAAGTMGELGPIVAMSLLLSQQYTTLQEFGFLMVFLVGRDFSGRNQFGATAAARFGAFGPLDAREFAAAGTCDSALVCCLFRAIGAIWLREHSGRVCRGNGRRISDPGSGRQSAADED